MIDWIISFFIMILFYYLLFICFIKETKKSRNEEINKSGNHKINPMFDDHPQDE
jgi:hypothetical protein